MDAQPYILASLALFSVAAAIVIGISYISYQLKLKNNPQPAISSSVNNSDLNFIDNAYVRDFRKKTGTKATQGRGYNSMDVTPMINQTYFHEPVNDAYYNQRAANNSYHTTRPETKHSTLIEIMGADEGRTTSLRPVKIENSQEENLMKDKKLLTFYED